MDLLPFGVLTELSPLAVPAILLVLVLPAWETAVVHISHVLQRLHFFFFNFFYNLHDLLQKKIARVYSKKKLQDLTIFSDASYIFSHSKSATSNGTRNVTFIVPPSPRCTSTALSKHGSPSDRCFPDFQCACARGGLPNKPLCAHKCVGQ